jgi:hypothetical protein
MCRLYAAVFQRENNKELTIHVVLEEPALFFFLYTSFLRAVASMMK